MAGKIKGITIEIAGNTQPLNKALESVNKQSKDLQTELKQVERLLKLDPQNTELLAQKQKLLADAVNNTKSKLDTLREAERQVQQQFKEGKVGEEQYRLIQREVIATEQNLKKLEKQLKEVNNGWDKAAKALDGFGKKATSAGKTLSMAVTAPIAAAGAASFKFAADLQDAMGASDQIFKTASSEVKSWADNLESYYGIAKGEALTYANTMGAMLQNIGGLTEQEAAKQSQILVELAGDLTAMFGGTTESAIQALTGALKGNNSMLDNYGMGVNEATIKTKALEMGLIEEGEQLDLASKQAATLALIMEQTADAQGQAQRESDGASGSLRGLTTELKNMAGELGEVLLPIITPFIAKLKDLIAKFGEMSPEMQKTIVIITGVAAAIGPLLVIIGQLSSGISAIISIAPALGAAFTVMTGPVGLIIAAIAALIAIGVLVYKNWDTIKEKAVEIWTAIKDFFVGIFTTIKDFFVSIWTSISNFFMDRYNKQKEATEKVFTAIKDFFVKIFTNIRDFFADVWGKISGFFSDTLGGIWDKAVSWASGWIDIGKNLVQGLWEGIKNMGSWLWDKVTGFFGGIVDGVKGIFGINSPSAVFADIGENLSLGLAKGIKGAKTAVDSALAGLISPQINVGLAGASPAGMGAITNTFVIQNMNVRSDQDIKLIARELHTLQQQAARGRGLA